MNYNVTILLLLFNLTVAFSTYTYVWHPHPRATNKGNNIKFDRMMGGMAQKNNADIYLYYYPYGEIKYGYVPHPGSQGPIEYNRREHSGRQAQMIPIYLLDEGN